VGEAVALVRHIELDVQSLDLEASAALTEILPPDLPNDGALFYRECIRRLLLSYQPFWTRTMLQGRSRFFTTLERDEQGLFRQTGIADEPPEDEFIEWWDLLTGEMRLVRSADQLARGRAAERLSIAHEIRRLREEGINERPKWTGLDDNTKGYDVLSYERKDGTLVNKLIEVKSTIASPLRFIVTRNEWEQANRSGTAYIFHIWDMQKEPAVLHIRSVEHVRVHVPSDNEKGKWQNAEIPLGSS
jgi:Domain of unknown function (DUF3883)